MTVQERLATEVAGLEKRKPNGASKAHKDVTAALTNVESIGIQTEVGTASHPDVAQQISGQPESSAVKAVTVTVCSVSVQTDAAAGGPELCCTSMQTEADPLAIQLADERALHDASQSRLECLSREVEQAQADYSVLHQMLTAKQAELLSAPQRVQALETEQLDHRELVQAQQLELQESKQRLEQLTQCLQQNAHTHAEALQYKQQSARFEQQAKDSTTALQDVVAEKQRLTQEIAKANADHAARQQQQASQLDSLSEELSAAQQRLADFDKACCTLHSLLVPSAAAAALDEASVMSPDSLVQLVTSLLEGARAVQVQMQEELIALTTAHATEVQLLRCVTLACPDFMYLLCKVS